MAFPSRSLVHLLISSAFLGGCEEQPARTEPAAPAAASPPAAATPEPKTESVPDLVLDSIGARVGAERVSLQLAEGATLLASVLNENRRHFEGKAVRLVIDRKAKPEWVSVYLAQLGKLGISEVQVRTETRGEYPSEVRFTPESRLEAPASCSVVAMILDDRGTAVWKLAGGTAGKRGKGMAGPDLTMTGETIERLAKACENGKALFVSGAPSIEWGLIYDLAASAQKLGGVSFFETRVLLSERPVPGHRVSVKR